MAYIDRDELTDFPFSGEFYRSEADASLPPSAQTARDVVICRVRCDIQEEGNYRATQASKAVYGVYVPFDSEADEVPVRRGHMFRGSQYGLLVAGRVIGVFPSQLGPFENHTDRGGDVVPHRCRCYVARVEATDV